MSRPSRKNQKANATKPKRPNSALSESREEAIRRADEVEKRLQAAGWKKMSNVGGGIVGGLPRT